MRIRSSVHGAIGQIAPAAGPPSSVDLTPSIISGFLSYYAIRDAGNWIFSKQAPGTVGITRMVAAPIVFGLSEKSGEVILANLVAAVVAAFAVLGRYGKPKRDDA